MAYLADQDEDKDKQQQGMSLEDQQQPLGQELQPEAQNSSIPLSSTSSSITPQTPGQTATQPQISAPKKPTPKGSGMFTSIRKYISANKPGAQRIAGAVGGNLGRQEAKVAQQIGKKERGFQRNLGEQQARIGSARQFGTEAIADAGTPGLTQDEVGRFRNIASGSTRFDILPNVNLTKEATATEKVAQLAGQAETDLGRRTLLKDTFKRLADYTRGQSGLDQLILQSDESARKQLIDQAKGVETGVQEGLDTSRRGIKEGVRGLEEEATGLKTGLTEELGGARTGLEDSVQSRLEAARQSLKQRQDDFSRALTQGTLTSEQLQPFLQSADVQQALQTYNVPMNRLHNFADLIARGEGVAGLQTVYGAPSDPGRAMHDNPLYEHSMMTELGKQVQGKLGTLVPEGTYHPIFSMMDDLRQLGYSKSQVEDLVRASVQDSEGFGTGISDRIKKNPRQKNRQDLINELVQQANTRRSVGANQYLNATGLDAIQRGNVLSEEDVAREAALADLAGLDDFQRSQVLGRAEDIGPGSYRFADALKYFRAL